MATITVCGIPKAQPRPRLGKYGAYNPQTAKAWKAKVALAAIPYRPKHPIAGAVGLRVVFDMPRPKRLMRRADPAGPVPHVAKPDVDNLLKAIMDCMTEIGMWIDDTQVIDCTIVKQYHAKGGHPGAVITIGKLLEGV